MRHIFKTFSSNGANALDYADFNLYDGEIHALLGENGAGKSTLMHILAGFIQPDSGQIFVDGKKYHFSHCADALKCGIGMVRQTPLFADELRVWEACTLNYTPAQKKSGISFFRQKTKIKAYVESVCQQWNLQLPIDNKIKTLNAAQRLQLALLSLLLRNVRCMIFDEPSAALNDEETKNFLSICYGFVHPQRITKAGDHQPEIGGGFLPHTPCSFDHQPKRSIVIISHKLEETLSIADSITILRKGKTVAAMSDGVCSKDDLIGFMFGSSAVANKNPRRRAALYFCPHGELHSVFNTPIKQNHEAVLEVKGLCVKGAGGDIGLHDVSFMPHNAICGVAGVRESGRRTLELAIAGLVASECGSVKINGKDISGMGSASFRDAGGAYLCNGSVLVNGKVIRAYDNNLSLQDNLLIHSHKNINAGPFLQGDKVAQSIGTVMRNAGLNKVDRKQRGCTLSGGMLQRLLISRDLAENGNFIIANDIGMALDSERKKIIFDLIIDAAQNGKNFLLFFSDIDDLVELCGEVIVLCGGKISAHFDLGSFAGESILQAKKNIRTAMVSA
ncbi:MAG: ABC transporter ATP-binding protein [Termitinemataceae bacterium]|nr:MAG: ABC transporter ATP-binding protein [Termitinemataceae bacterium]